jgi:GT2 family glycosyltransferase
VNKISVLIVTWNRVEELQRSIDSVYQQSFQDFEVVVIDNASTDGTFELVAERYPRIKLIRTAFNMGCPSGRNLGFSNCLGEYIYCLDDDGWLEKDALKYALECFELYENVAIVQSQVNEVVKNQLVRKRFSSHKSIKVGSFSGGCSMIKKDILEKVGYYPEDFFRQCEEEDLMLRIFDAGWECAFEPRSVMYHAPSFLNRNEYTNYKYTLCNSIKIALRRWPSPWNALRVAKMFMLSIKYSVFYKKPLFPMSLFITTCITLGGLRESRQPISKEKFLLYKDF